MLSLNKSQLRQLRARDVSMVYQEPGRALNPSILVGRQVAEVYEIAGLHRGEATERALDILRKVQISDPKGVMGRYPHQLSGGMLQRVVIAMALASEPSLLILDEPTTALDATVEAEVLELIRGLRSEFNTSLLFISHNLAVIAKMCDRVGVLYAGELVEEGPANEIFSDPRHPYTVGLLRSIPRREAGDARQPPRHPGHDSRVASGPRLGDRGLHLCRSLRPGRRSLPRRRAADVRDRRRARLALPLPRARAERADGRHRRGAGRCHRPEHCPVDRTADPGALGVQDVPHGRPERPRAVRRRPRHPPRGDRRPGRRVGQRQDDARPRADGHHPPDPGGEIDLDGHAVAALAKGRSSADQKALQIVFQNPDSALNRRHSVRQLISRSLSKLGGYGGDKLKERLLSLVASVRLPERYLPMKPSQLSGGLKQRVAIARAFAGDPRIVVCDEPTSALDVSVQAAILNLLTDLQQRKEVAYLFISHDLGVVRYLADRIVVLYLGRVMEIGPAEVVFGGPSHPYTEALLSAVPTLDDLDRLRIRLEGEIPSAADPPSRLPVPYPVPPQDRRDLRDDRARARGGRGRSRHPLPHPARRAAAAAADARRGDPHPGRPGRARRGAGVGLALDRASPAPATLHGRAPAISAAAIAAQGRITAR